MLLGEENKKNKETKERSIRKNVGAGGLLKLHFQNYTLKLLIWKKERRKDNEKNKKFDNVIRNNEKQADDFILYYVHSKNIIFPKMTIKFQLMIKNVINIIFKIFQTTVWSW